MTDHRQELGVILDKLGFDEFVEQLKDAARESDEGQLNPDECEDFIDCLAQYEGGEMEEDEDDDA